MKMGTKNAVISTSLLLALMVRTATADVTTTAGTVNLSGSTAFNNFFGAPGATNDFIDVNNDGIFGFNPSGGSGETDTPFVQQLAPNPIISGGALTGYTTGTNISGASVVGQWSVQYRGVGSVNGLVEFVNYQLAGAIPTPSSPLGDPGRLNRTIVTTVAGGSPYTGPGAFPTNTPMTSIDAGVLDVRTAWAVQGSAGVAAWNAKPTVAGYGQNAALPTGATTLGNKLATLSVSASASLNLNTASPNSKTVFDTSIAFAPVSFAANHGTGIQKLTQTQLQTLYVTGRMDDGSNLVAATRDVGSGTRNGAMNSIGVDPSWGTGENIGDLTNNPNQFRLGSHFQPTNIDSTGNMVNVLTRNRLAVGYVSSTNGKNDQAAGNYEVLGVKFDLEGGTDYVRPTGDTIVNNGTDGAFGTGYRVGGSETFATVGDPLATTVNSTYSALTTNPQMANTDAAKYIRNILESINAYTSNPSATTNTFMPAQALVASNFIPLAASKYVQDVNDPTHWILNSNFNSTVNGVISALAGLNTGAWGSGTNPYGNAPTREALGNGTYSDGQPQNYRYFDNTGTQQTLIANAALNARNAISGDFNGSGTRDVTQISEMMVAVKDPTAWAMAHHSGISGAGLGAAAIPEIIGDFNGDGNFDSNDVRYYADGLAIAPANGTVAAHLDRKAAFTAVDTAWTVGTAGHPAGNYFNTVINNTKHAYVAGDSRGDIAGSTAGPHAGGAPTGADGRVDAKDVDYEIAQIKGATGQSLVVDTNGADPNLDVNGNWRTLLTRATANSNVNVRADLSADMNGDLAVNKGDLDELIHVILGTEYGDADLNGVIDINDLTAVANHWQANITSWSAGDFNGDGKIDINDLTTVANHWQFGAGPGFTGESFAQALTEFSNPSGVSVPEPASLGLLSMSALLLLRRKSSR